MQRETGCWQLQVGGLQTQLRAAPAALWTASTTLHFGCRRCRWRRKRHSWGQGRASEARYHHCHCLLPLEGLLS